MSRRGNRRRRRHPLPKVIVVLVVIVLIVVLGYKYIYQPVKSKVASTMAEKVIEAQLASDPELAAQADEILDSMSESDRETVEGIVESHMDAAAISKAAGYAASGDTSSLKEFAKEILSDQEIAEIKEIYNKYR